MTLSPTAGVLTGRLGPETGAKFSSHCGFREAFGFRSKDGEDRAVFRGPCREGLFLRHELRQVYRLVGKRAETALSGGLLSRCREGLTAAGNSAQKRAAGARGI